VLPQLKMFIRETEQNHTGKFGVLEGLSLPS
jgi:hypothetical protein